MRAPVLFADATGNAANAHRLRVGVIVEHVTHAKADIPSSLFRWRALTREFLRIVELLWPATRHRANVLLRVGFGAIAALATGRSTWDRLYWRRPHCALGFLILAGLLRAIVWGWRRRGHSTSGWGWRRGRHW